MNDSIEEFLKEIVISKKEEMKINKFQIENMKINSIFVKNKENGKKMIVEKNTKLFSEINENILNENDTLDFKVEIEVVQFGKRNFGNENISIENKEEKELKKKRYIDKNGNIFFVLKGKNWIKINYKNKLKNKKWIYKKIKIKIKL